MNVAEIERAVATLRRGGLVAFPTETVYGLGADASNVAALERIFEAKERPRDHPLIVHVADGVQLANWARDIPQSAHTLALRYWPGPLTLILKRAGHVSDAVTGGQDTVAVRVPAHPVAQALLRAFGGGVAAPSANRHGRVSATTAEHVRREFGDALECVLDGGACEVGIESTIVDLSGAAPVLLRPGAITAEQIGAALRGEVGLPDRASPRAPGMLARHYAPQTALQLMEADLLLELARSLTRQGKRVAVLARSTLQPLMPGLTWLAAPRDPSIYAHDLYGNLRQLDDLGCDAILVEELPVTPEWIAVRDRLTRAAAGSAAGADDLDP
jgi:L-threonylcarbamoyladenylate synthase